MIRRLRPLTLLLAAVQFALPAMAALGDGAASRENPTGMHVESTSGRDCTPPHSADCAVCRYLTAAFSRGASADVDLASLERPSPSFRPGDEPASATAGRLPPSRAPPAV